MKKIYLFIPFIGMVIGSKQSDKYIYDNAYIYLFSTCVQALYCALFVLLLLTL